MSGRPFHPDPAGIAATRSRFHRLLAHLFVYPDAAWVAAIRAGEVARAVENFRTPDGLPSLTFDAAALSDAGATDTDDALAIEYTRLFDVGPVSLHGGHHFGARMQVMEEVLRFYEHFGLAPDAQANALPDHLVSELEFMHYLAHREAEHLAAGRDARPWQRGQRDFLARQLGRWAPQLHDRLVAQQALPFFSEAARLLGEFLAQERTRLEAVTARAA